MCWAIVLAAKRINNRHVASLSSFQCQAGEDLLGQTYWHWRNGGRMRMCDGERIGEFRQRKMRAKSAISLPLILWWVSMYFSQCVLQSCFPFTHSMLAFCHALIRWFVACVHASILFFNCCHCIGHFIRSPFRWFNTCIWAKIQVVGWHWFCFGGLVDMQCTGARQQTWGRTWHNSSCKS